MLLRPYQLEILHAVPHGPGKRTLVSLPTGAGKTCLAAAYAQLRAPTLAAPLWFIVHRRELLDQAFGAFKDAGFDPGLIASSCKPDPYRPVQIATVQTLCYRNLEALPPPAFLVFDEAHHVAANSWVRLLRAFPEAEILGLTATPSRADGKPLGAHFQTMIQGPGTRELIEQGSLSPYRYFLGSEPDLSTVRTIGGDYDAGQSTRAVQRSFDKLNVALPWECWHKENLRGPSLAFCPTREFSKYIAEEFTKMGVRAAHVDFETPTIERKETIAAWKAGEIQLLSNVDLFGEGVNCPAIDSVFLLRPTKSLNVYRQMTGRGLRVHPDGTPLKIFDHAGCVQTHGLPDADIAWSLTSKPQRAAGPCELLFCPECGAQLGTCACEHCGKSGDTAPRAVRICQGDMHMIAGPPEGCMSVAEYAVAQRKTPATIRKWVAKGMPMRDGWIDATTADPWVATRNEAWRRNARGWILTRAMQAKLRTVPPLPDKL
jgi:superfamily II DNA or RNA helicase